MRQFLLLLACILTVSTINVEGGDHQNPHSHAEIIYHNGHIITMDPSNEHPSFVAVTKGKIVTVSRERKEIKKLIGPNTQLIDLEGKTLIPGLVDAHSHFSTTATQFATGFNIAPPPFGPVTSIPILVDVVKAHLAAHNIPPGQPIYGIGYSDLEMEERRHPTRYELDQISTVHPIVLTHFSVHFMAVNSLALDMIGYHDASSVPKGGLLDTFENGTLTGVCREHAIFPLYAKFGLTFAKLTPEQIINTAYEYFSSGVTTAQDLVLSRMQPTVYRKLGDSLPIDVNGYYLIKSPDLTTFEDIMTNYSTSRFRPTGGKFWLDGSIQGYTALLTQPYFIPQSQYYDDHSSYVYDATRSCANEDCGADNFPAPTLLRELFKTLLNNNMDINAHCNGDASADNMIRALEWARSNSNSNSTSRVAMIHAQTLREDQLDKMVQLDIIPSFFPVHLYYWGDKHYNIFLGPTRANRMNPIGSAIRRNLTFTLHNDSPVVLAGVVNGVNTFLKIISSAVNRMTSSGRVLDDGTQKISVYDALKGVTINSAFQAHQQDIKGSITVGKVADFAVLNLNPLAIDPLDLDRLTVLTTIKGGKVVFGSLPESTNIDEMR